jgi:hypothetical protein
LCAAGEDEQGQSLGPGRGDARLQRDGAEDEAERNHAQQERELIPDSVQELPPGSVGN